MPKRNVLEIVVEGEDKASSVLRGVNTQLDSIGRLATTAVVGGIAAATTAVIGFGAASLNEFNKFQQGMNEVFTLLPDISQEAMGKLEQDVQRVNARFGLLNEQTIPALYQAISAGVPTDNVLSFMSTAAQASIGGVTSLETAVDGITSVVNAYGEEAINAQQASDLMFTAVKLGKTDFDQLSRSLFQVVPTAASLGLEFGNVTAALASLTSQGTPTSVATTQLRQLMVELQKPTTKVSKLFEEMAGKSFPDFINEGGNLADALQMISDGATEGDVELAGLFGSVEALNAFLGLTGANAEGFADNLAEMAGSAGATEKAFDTMSQGMQFQIDRMRAKFQTFLTNIGRSLEPFVTPLFEALGDALSFLDAFFSGVSSFEDDFNSGPGGIFNSLLNGLLTILEALVPVRDELTNFFGAIGAGVPFLDALSVTIGNLFGSDVQETFENIRNAISQVWQVILQVTEPIRNWISENVELKDVLIVIGGLIASVVIPAIAGFVAALATPIAIVGGLIVAVAALRNAWENDFGGIRTFVETTLLPALEKIRVWFVETAMPAVMDFINNTIIPGLETWQGILANIWTIVEPALNNIKQWFTETALPAIMEFIENAKTRVSELIETIQGIWTNVSGALADFKSGIDRVFNDIKNNVIQPIIDRINEFIQTVKNVLTQLGLIQTEATAANNALNAVANNPGNAITNSGALFGAQNGIDVVRKPMIIRVHPGEQVVPARDNPNLGNGGEQIGNTNNIYLTISGSDNPRELADQFVGALRSKGVELAR